MFSGNESQYYLVVLLSLGYLVFKYGVKNLLYLFIILLFYDGLFAYFGSVIWNMYKAAMPVVLLFAMVRTRTLVFDVKNTMNIRLSFMFFTFSFFLSSFLNGDNLTLILSQFAKYLILFMSVFLFKNIVDRHPSFLHRIAYLLFEILVIQGILAVVKFFLMGVVESIIGTVSYTGGAAGTSLPILGFIFLWIIKDGKLGRKDWIIVLLLLFIGFGSMKRAIWFILPPVMFLLYYYVPKRKLNKRLLYAIPVIPLVFYLGVRLNPTLNPESTYWGDFDLDYTLSYASEYTFGNEENISGRGGATLALIDKIFSLDYTKTDLVGVGMKTVHATDTETFNELGFNVDHKGSATGIFQTYISNGFLGIIATLLFGMSIMMLVNHRRMRYSIIIFFLWEYIFYTGIILRTPALSILLLFIIIYFNQFSSLKDFHLNRNFK